MVAKTLFILFLLHMCGLHYVSAVIAQASSSGGLKEVGNVESRQSALQNLLQGNSISHSVHITAYNYYVCTG